MQLNLRQRLVFYLDFGCVHGIRYLGKRCSTVIGKVFWALVLVISALGMSYIFHRTLDSFRHDVVVVNLDTAYLHWTNVFPAVSLCITRGLRTKALGAFTEQYFKRHNMSLPPRFQSYVKVLQDYMFITPTTDIHSFDYCRSANGSCGVDMQAFKDVLLPQHCRQFMRNLSFLGRSYANCDELFRPHETEMGLCFIANSLQSHGWVRDQLPMQYDRMNPERRLSFEYIEMDTSLLTLYVHSPEQFPHFNMEMHNLAGNGVTYYFSYSTVEMENSDDVKAVAVATRDCRFPDDRLPKSKLNYSFSSCLTYLRNRVEFDECNCTIPTTATVGFEASYCDYYGLRCITSTNIVEQVNELHKRKETRCMQSCIEIEVNSVSERFKMETDIKQMGALHIEIGNVPTLRYRRNVAKTQLDMIVSVGGVIGLFFGASLLSLVELIYVWIVRRF